MILLVPIPLGTNIARRSIPWVTISLVCLNTLILIWQYSYDMEAAVFEFGLIPRKTTLLTAVSHMFLHGDPLHLIGNMLLLWILGTTVEDRLGPLVFAIVYLAGGVAAGLSHIIMAHLFDPASLEMPLVGASGAVFGVAGFFAVRFYRNKVRFLIFLLLLIYLRIFVTEINALVVVGFFFIENLWYGVTFLGERGGGVAYWAHVGGGLFGVAVGLIMRLHREAATEYAVEEATQMDRFGAPLAVEQLQPLVQQQPGNEALREKLVEALLTAGRQAEAFAHLWELALHRCRTGRRREVPALLARFDAAEFARWLDPPNLYQVALCYEEAGQFEQALDLLRQVCVKSPGSRDAEMATLRAGRMLLDGMGQVAKAAEIFTYFLRAFPESEWADFAREALRRVSSRLHPSG